MQNTKQMTHERLELPTFGSGIRSSTNWANESLWWLLIILNLIICLKYFTQCVGFLFHSIVSKFTRYPTDCICCVHTRINGFLLGTYLYRYRIVRVLRLEEWSIVFVGLNTSSAPSCRVLLKFRRSLPFASAITSVFRILLLVAADDVLLLEAWSGTRDLVWHQHYDR